MEDLFKFYAIRAPEPLAPEQSISLDTQSPYQTELRSLTEQSVAARARRLSELNLSKSIEPLVGLVNSQGAALSSFAEWFATTSQATTATASAYDSSIRSKIRELFGDDATSLQGHVNSSTSQLVKDAIVSLRLLDMNAESLQTLLHTDAHRFAATLVTYLRFNRLLDFAAAPFEQLTVARVMGAKLVTDLVDLLGRPDPVGNPASGPSTAELLAAATQTLKDLGRLLLRIERACPGDLAEPAEATIGPPPGVRSDGGRGAPTGGSRRAAPELSTSLRQAAAPELSTSLRHVLETEFAGLPERILTALHRGVAPAPPPPASGWLLGAWSDLYLSLEAQAKELQLIVDALRAELTQSQTPSVSAPSEPATPLAAGYMRLAGITDVKVVRAHIVRYEDEEIAQIENVLQGETRMRRFRTLNRREENTQSQTESQLTEETEIKTEDKTSLSSSVQDMLKEGLDLKVGFDLKSKVGDTQIGLNTSFGFSRSTEETKKASADFAKDVTNRAARKVSQIVRTTIETRVLQEAEETVDHDFDATQATGNIVGLYQWIDKVNRVQIFGLGDQKRAVLDGVILQPSQRLLGAPAQSGKSTLALPPPPVLDVLPSEIHPWNYLSLAAKFGASSVSAPPPLTVSMSFSSAGPQNGDVDKVSNFAVAQDIALPDATAAAYGTVTLSAAVHRDFDYEHAIAVLGRQSWIAVGKDAVNEQVHTHSNATEEIRSTGTKLLAGEQISLPFTFFGGQCTGYAVAADITCVRTQVAYEAWQIGVYGALRAASSQAWKDYHDQADRARLDQVYNLGPAPGRVDQVIREEIKRCTIAVLAKQSAADSFYDDLNALYARGAYTDVAQRCLFFEHALEWENMTYILYPYFWADGRDDGWGKHLNRDEKDDNLVEFLRSGAARVVVPVRPLPKDAAKGLRDFASYLSAMALPSLPELLDVGSPLYLAIEQEIKERDGAVPETFEDEWEVHVPTQLVRLRSDAGFPRIPTWSEPRDASGNLIKGNFVEDSI